MCYYIKIYIFQNWILFYPAFPTRKLRYDVCAAVRPPLQGTEGCARSTAVCIIPLHAGASKQPVFRYMGILPGCCSGTFRLLSVAFLSGPTASWANGDTFCLCRPSCLRHVTGRKSPHFVCPADRFFYPPKPSFITFINIPLYIRDNSAFYICIGITFSRHTLPAAA